jgi:hypothetical protein
MTEIITRAEALLLADEIEAEARYRLQLAREAYERGREDGWHTGREDAHREMERAWQRIARAGSAWGNHHRRTRGATLGARRP